GLDPSTLPQDVDLAQSNVNVYPTKGAVVKASFATRIGYQVLMTLKQGAKHVPFGAVATLISDNAAETISSIVGDAGQVYLTGLPEKGELLVKWGETLAQQCQVSFDLRNLSISTDMPIRQVSYRCVSGQKQVQPQVEYKAETVNDKPVVTSKQEVIQPSNAPNRKRWLQPPVGELK
ncbi:fimbrial biogenesis outer membrane usher protein, partial [Providencia stuartii]|nr:fimbrial biogenesis outer membrane usher protein [Providencia stuartii]